MPAGRSPEIIFNKGRRGWGLTALQHYAPEYQGQFRLHWVAAKRGSFIWCVDAEYPLDNLLNSAMDPAERQRFDRRWRECQLNDDWVPVPLHPWQWQQKIALHFLPQLAEGELIELGEFGDHYLAQQSLRTLTNVSAVCHLISNCHSPFTTPLVIVASQANTSAQAPRLRAGCSKSSHKTAHCMKAGLRSSVNPPQVICCTRPTPHLPSALSLPGNARCDLARESVLLFARG